MLSRCNLSVPDLGALELFHVNRTETRTTLHLVISLNSKLNAWDADGAVAEVDRLPSATLRTTIRMPGRLVLELTLPTSPTTASDAVHQMASLLAGLLKLI